MDNMIENLNVASESMLPLTSGLENLPIQSHSLPSGCYLMKYSPYHDLRLKYDGTLRVERSGNGYSVSGDLYQRPIIWVDHVSIPHVGEQPIPIPDPRPADGIPSFSRWAYSYYLRAIKIPESTISNNSFALRLKVFKFNLETNSWSNKAHWIALMSWVPAPLGFPALVL